MVSSASEQPAQERDDDADNNAGDDRKIEREISLLYRNVPGKFTHPAEKTRETPKDHPGNDQKHPDDYDESPDLLH